MGRINSHNAAFSHGNLSGSDNNNHCALRSNTEGVPHPLNLSGGANIQFHVGGLILVAIIEPSISHQDRMIRFGEVLSSLKVV